MTLTDEERRRIYEEEKARIEAQEKIRSERSQDNLSSQSSKGIGCLGWIGIFFVLFLLLLAISTISPHKKSVNPSQTSSSSPGDAGLVKGLGKDVLRKELDSWNSIGLVTSYEFSEQTVIVYLNHTDWISLTSGNRADFKAAIRAKWPDGSVVFRDSQTGERL